MNTTLAKLIAGLALTGTTVAMAASDVTTGTMGQTSRQVTEASIATMDVDDIEGKDILDSSGTQLGDVDEIVVNKAKQSMAVIGLEDSNKEVAVPLSKLALSGDGKNLVTRLTKAELLALPDYDPLDMESVEE
jgi:sporulation protein YlmC with PRC-barrel domain